MVEEVPHAAAVLDLEGLGVEDELVGGLAALLAHALKLLGALALEHVKAHLQGARDLGVAGQLVAQLAAGLDEGALDVAKGLLLGLVHEGVDERRGVLLADAIIVLALGQIKALEGSRIGHLGLELFADGEHGEALGGQRDLLALIFEELQIDEGL